MTAQDVIASPRLAKLTVRDVLLLSDAGAFGAYARAELIEGEIWVVKAVHRRHARAHAALTVELGIALKAIGDPLQLFSNPATELSDLSLPEPDIVIAIPADGKLLAGPEVRLAVEISDSTLSMDFGRKAGLYAKHAVPEYWVADVESRVIHRMWAPEGEAYAKADSVPFGTAIAARTIAALSVETLAL